jgi:formylglycine-generating enzyme required for sulfatase activity
MRNLQTFDFETVTVDVQGNITNRKGNQAKFMSEDLGGGASLEMIAIPGGSFVMGSPTNTESQQENNERPQHKVNISPFFMGKYEVTQEQWQAVMENNPSNFIGAKLPVEKVSWNDAVEFCEKLSQKTGKTYRLPSEAEWEYACRARTKTPFHFGETITPDLVNYNGYPYGSAQWGLDRKQTTDVGSFPPNAFGLYDMHGNVNEWCSDSWNNNYNGAPNDGSSWETHYDLRVFRGGSWKCNAVHCRSAYRAGYGAGDLSSTGFRVALVSVPTLLTS